MNRHIQHTTPYKHRNSRNKAARQKDEEALQRARESASIMLANLSLSKTVAQLKKQ